MTKLNCIIEQFCPNGVEYKTIEDIAIDIFRGSGIKRDQVTPEGIPCVRYGEIYTTYNLWFDECVSHTELEYVQSPKYFEYGNILFAITGESVEEIAKSIAYVGHEKCLAGGDIVVLKHNQNPKYLSYALSTVDAQKQKSAGKVKSKVVHSSVPAIKSIVIPVPPLEVQEEIVKILDNFTEQLAELTAELTARKKQYEAYKDKLYTFDDTVTRVTTKVITTDRFWLMPATPKYFDDGIPYITSKNITNGIIDFSNVKYISREDYEVISKNRRICSNDLLITMIGTIGETAFVGDNTEFYGQNLYLIRFDETKCLRKYYYYYISSERVKCSLISGKNPSSQGYIKAGSIDDLLIPLPSISDQQRIVNILDSFNKLCFDITEGLPAEIEARQKQYEFYRDKLLTYKPVQTTNT